MLNISSQIANLNLKKASEAVNKTPMTERQVKATAEALKKGNRVNCFPNKFDVSQPIRVAVRSGNKYQNYGFFKNPDVASCVGTLVGIAHFGQKALIGDFDQAVVEGAGKDEYTRWLDDSRNAEVIQTYEEQISNIEAAGVADDEPVTDDILPF